MDPQQTTTQPSAPKEPKAPRRPSVARRILKAVLWTVGIIIALVLVVLTVAVNYLKPERLTPLVEQIANENMNASLSLGRVEISFWSTFPRFELDVQDLNLRSKALDALPDSIKATLPECADSLLSFSRLQGAINIPKLCVGHIELYDIILTGPKANLVQATPEVSNLDIFPPSEPDTTSAPVSVPPITLAKFVIKDSFPVRYISVPDSLNVGLALTTTHLSEEDPTLYALNVTGLTSASVSDFKITDLKIGADGAIRWDYANPMSVGLEEFLLGVGDVTVNVTSQIDFADILTVNSLKVNLPQTPLTDIVALIPQDMQGELAKVKSNLEVAAEVSLTEPFRVGIDSIPSLKASINVPEGAASYDGMSLDKFELQADATIDGTDLNKSTVNVSRLFAQGEGMGFVLTGKARNLIADPTAEGVFRGGLSIAHLPKKLLEMIPGTASGLLKADCDFALRQSYLTKDNFHKIKMKGDATLTNLNVDMPEQPASIYSREMKLTFGTSSRFTRGEHSVDSLLTASLAIDTISCHYDGMDLRGSGLKAGVGAQNTASSSDTTQVNPIGGRVVANRLFFRSEADSMRVWLREASVGGALRRFKGDSKAPMLTLHIAADGAMYGDKINWAMLSKALSVVTVYPSPARNAHRRDSLRRLMQGPDSARIAAAMKARPFPANEPDVEVLDIEVDKSLKQVLRRWKARGTLRSDQVRVFTPLFPLRTRMHHLVMDFTTDSIKVDSTQLRLGRSDFMVNGTISNIARALTSSTGRQPLRMNFQLQSDTIDVNEIAAATFAGAAYAETHPTEPLELEPALETMDESKMEAAVATPTDTAAVFVVPSNIEATLNVKAVNIVYSNLAFHNFSGTINAYDGAINLSQLSAKSDVGNVDLNALYSARTKHDASFAFGMRVQDFRIGQFMGLIPSIDSLMPLLNGIDGIINADMAATTNIDSAMNLDIPSLKAAMKISGDSLVVIDGETFRTIGKWLLFKNKTRNVIDSMAVEMVVDNSQLRMFPFIFNLDRYKLGVMGSNDLAMNFNYHVAVLKSPLPFKFGVNISGNPDKMKFRLGKAKLNEKDMAKTIQIADTTRVNLVSEIRNVFRRGVRNSRMRRLDFTKVGQNILNDDLRADTISHADSLVFINEGLIPKPDTVAPAPVKPSKRKKK